MTVVMVLLTLFLVIFGWQKLHDPNFMPLRHVQIQAPYLKLKQETLRQALAPMLQGNFLSIDIEGIKAQLTAIPWIATVNIQRQWPDTLQINVTEHQAIARWNEKGLLSAAGAIFYPEAISFPKQLPQFKGPDTQSAIVLSFYQELSPVLKTIKHSIAAVELSSRRAWEFELDNHVRVLLGRENLTVRVKRFLTIYQHVPKERQASVGYVDMRYPNGGAVQWRAADKTEAKLN